MKRLLFLLVFCICSLVVYPIDSIYNRDKPSEIVGWHVHVLDDDVDATAELITTLDSTYAQLAAADKIEVLSAEAADTTQTVTVTGIDSSGNKAIETFALTGTTAVSSSTTFSYIDQVSLDSEATGAVTIRRATGDTFITSIAIGELEAGMVQHFNGEYDSYITQWDCGVNTTTGDINFELRWYPDDADCLDAADGYKVLDRMFISKDATSPYNHTRTYAQPIKCPAGGWIAVYGTGSAANTDGIVTLQGYDTKR